MMLFVIVILAFGSAVFGQQSGLPPGDGSPHKISFVDVGGGVRLEVLDWGGHGRALVFLAGLGMTAHEFDEFAPQFTTNYHVYGVTRRGFGASTAPPPTVENYAADRLGDDVIAVIEAFHLERPVLVGHSIAGEELSSIGSRFPGKVAGLVYLEAAYAYAYYDRANGDFWLDAIDLRNRLNVFLSADVKDTKGFLSELHAYLPQVESGVADYEQRLAVWPPSTPQAPPATLVAVSDGERKYTDIHVPVLAFFAAPHPFNGAFANDPVARQKLLEDDAKRTKTQAEAVEKGIPGSRVVVIPNADHFIFRSNEVEVVHDMTAFLATLR